MDMVWRFPHQGFQDPSQLFWCAIADSPYTRNYGPQWYSFFVDFGEPIEFRDPAPVG